MKKSGYIIVVVVMLLRCEEQAQAEPQVQDIVKGELNDNPWQFKPYDKSSATWLAAASGPPVPL